MSGRILLLSLLCLWASASAREPDALMRVRLHVDPPGASIYGPDGLWGRADQELPLDARRYSSDVQIRLEAPGYQPLTRTLSLAELSDPQGYPPGGESLHLVPLHWWVPGQAWAGANPVLAGLLGLGLVAVPLAAGAGLARSRASSRAVRQQLEEQAARLKVQEESQDALLQTDYGGYFLAERLGSGGMGQVYLGYPLAHKGNPSEAVAVKVIRREIWTDPECGYEYQKRFRREVKILQSLRHSGIVQLMDWSEDHHYVVMELIRGGTLKTVLEAGLPEPRQAAAMVSQMAEALMHAHQQDIIHRDLKPDNVLVTGKGVLKITDFGLAMDWAQIESFQTRSGTTLGSPAYMAPEQMEGKTIPEADQYSLGVMAFELLAGRPPFVDSNPMKLLMLQRFDAPPNLTDLRPEVSPAVNAVVQKMLAKEPDQRYPDVREAAQALQQAVESA